MLSTIVIREEFQRIFEGLQKKGVKEGKEKLDLVLSLDDKRKAGQTELDANLAEANLLAKEIGTLMKSGRKEDAEAMRDRANELKAIAKQQEDALRQTEADLFQALVVLPNIPHTSVPNGKSAEDNEIIYQVSTLPELPSDAQPHWDLIKKYDIIDFETGNKVTGAGFPIYKGKGARFQRSLIQFFLNEGEKAGYTEIGAPILVNADSGFGTGQLPDKDGQMYYIPEDGLYVIPTAEVPITNIYRNEIVRSEDLPIRMMGYTPCFRREAGSWGQDVRGLNRLHQFDKVEIVQLVEPEHSYQVLEEMRAHVASLLEQLGLPYRILRLCGGDMSFTSALTYDFEVWSAAQKRWLEVSSVSNFEAYQANRLKLRYKVEGKTRNLHTLNGSALALPRIMAAIIENFQSAEGIHIPECLQAYTGFKLIS